MSNSIQRLLAQGQSVWCDNISRHMIDSGELRRLIDLGVTGVTSNPTIFMKAITGSGSYDKLFDTLRAEGRSGLDLYEGLVMPDIAGAADELRAVYDSTNGADGYVSLEVNPQLAYDTDATIKEGKRLFAELGRPNIMIKVPATQEGIPAIEELIAGGVNVNVTLIFGLAVYQQVMAAYLDGLKRLDASGGKVGNVASVASFFVSRIDSAIDKQITDRGIDSALAGQAAIANARLAYAHFEQVFDAKFNPWAEKGARVQRPLWASTSTKNPSYPDTMYVDELVAPQSVNTLPPATLEALLDHGQTEISIRHKLDESRRLFDDLRQQGIDIDTVTDELSRAGVDLFAESFEQLLADLAAKQQRLGATG